MSRQRLIALLIAALAAISAAVYLSAQRNVAREVHGEPLLPSLAGELNSVSSVSVLKGSATPAVTVHKQGEQWTVAERANYPADVAKVRKLLLSLSDAKIREEKTSDPAKYSIIGVEDPTQPGATGAQIELLANQPANQPANQAANQGKHAVIVGKPVDQGNFVRRVGEKSSYIVEPGISLEAEPRYWIDTHLLDISEDKIQSIQFKPESGPSYTLRRVSEPAPATPAAPAASAAPATATTPATPAAPATATTPATPTAPATPATAPQPVAPAVPAPSKFVLEGVPSGRQAADANTLRPSPTTFSNLSDDDVAPVADIDFSKPSTVTLSLSDGSVVVLTGTAAGEKRWLQIAAPKDAALSARTAGRAFEIPSYRYDQIFKPLEQLLVPKPAPPAKPGATGSTPGASGIRPAAQGPKAASSAKPVAAPPKP